MCRHSKETIFKLKCMGASVVVINITGFPPLLGPLVTTHLPICF